MKISIYTAIKNGIANDFHALAMLRHHLPLADEIVVNEGYSTDESYEKISNIDPKIKVFRTKWEVPAGLDWSNSFKNDAKNMATGDWCILLDADEFIPEWQFDEIRNYLLDSKEMMHSMQFINFYGNYKVYHAAPLKVFWPDRKMNIHRNSDSIEIWGDGSNVKIKGVEFKWDVDESMFMVHHMGMVRDPAILRKKWWIQGRAINGKRVRFSPPDFMFRLFPHDWRDPQFFDDLRLYDGPLIKAVRDDPGEFIRDNEMLIKYIETR